MEDRDTPYPLRLEERPEDHVGVKQRSEDFHTKYLLKDALSSDSELLERYYHFVAERNRQRVSDWLESINAKLIIES